MWLENHPNQAVDQIVGWPCLEMDERLARSESDFAFEDRATTTLVELLIAKSVGTGDAVKVTKGHSLTQRRSNDATL